MTVMLLVLAALAALALAAFCAGAETGFLSVSRERVLHLSRSGGRKAKIVERSLHDLARTTTTLLIGNNLASVTYSSATAALSSIFFSDSAAAHAIWSFLAAFIVLYFSEFMPKLICAARPLRHTLVMADAYRVLALLLKPFTVVAMRLTDLFVPRRESRYRLTADDLMRILRDRKDGVCLSDIESALISRLVSMRVKGEPITPAAILAALRDLD